MSSNIPEYYKELSVRLNGVLDAKGLREDIRWKRINMSIQSEELKSLSFNGPVHYFGSQAEATTTPGLHSDIDFVFCLDITAEQDLEKWMPHNNSFFIVSDGDTPPGYIKLQRIVPDISLPMYDDSDGQFKLDRYGRSVLTNDFVNLNVTCHEHHGPANTFYFGDNMRIDGVLAVKLYSWPDQASHWLTRNRRYNWPSQEMIILIQKTGALLVPVGHKLSQEQHLEWRVSISYGEKLLMWLLNSTQYKCYILLKITNKCFIKPVVSDDALSSYHLKTCMFYTIENTPAAIWQPDNLLLCLEMCLRLLFVWIECKICPNYFIPEENMFQCKMYGHIPGQLLSVLSNLLREEGRYLVRISCDNIGETLVRTYQTPVMELELHGEDVAQVLFTSSLLLFTDLKGALRNAVSKEWRFESRLQNRMYICHGPRQEVNSILWKMFCSYIGSKLASQSLSEETPDLHAMDIAHEFLSCGSGSDVTSGKLKLAAFYLVQDNPDISEYVLNEIHKKYSYKILDRKGKFQHMLHTTLSENISTTQVICQYIALPVHYHSSEINCIPKALILEIFRSIGSDEVDSDKDILPNLVSVDPKLYLYFLDFLCFHSQNKRLHKKVALDNMIYVIRHEEPDFEDTALNLLAYCLLQEGKLLGAYNILCKSMKLTKEHNAAKFQIATIINAAFRFLRGGQ